MDALSIEIKLAGIAFSVLIVSLILLNISSSLTVFRMNARLEAMSKEPAAKIIIHSPYPMTYSVEPRPNDGISVEKKGKE